MTDNRSTVVGPFHDRDAARDAIEALKDAGFAAQDISILSPDKQETHDVAEETEVKSGRTLVTVRADGRYAEAQQLLRAHGAYDMQSAGQTVGTTQAVRATGTTSNAPRAANALELRDDPRYRGRPWSSVEADLERDWTSHNPGKPRGASRDALRRGWDDATR
jgi:Heat induced stress protein YflT domain